MRKLQIVTNILVLLFLAAHGAIYYRLAVELMHLNRQIEDAKAAIAEPAEVLKALIRVGARRVTSRPTQDQKSRDEKFQAYFEKVRNSGHTFYRKGRPRSAESMADKLESKYKTWSWLIADDDELLYTITRTAETDEGQVSIRPYQVEIDGQKLDLKDWLAGKD